MNISDEPARPTDQYMIDYMADNLEVNVDVITNLLKFEAYGTSYVNMSLAMRNTGSLDIPAGGTWKIYFTR